MTVWPSQAKVNLTLHVTGRRDDGYHLLDSLVVRAAVGDVLRVEPADSLTLVVDGPRAAGVPTDDRNLVLRAAALLDAGQGRGATLRLTKVLPNAAGIGGGSANAASALRALSRLWDVPVPPDVTSLGADVPVCLATAPQRMRGIGEHLSPVTGMPPGWLVLINPGVSVATAAVFDALDSRDNAPMPDVLPGFSTVEDFANWLSMQRNDLEAAARDMVPEIARALDCLRPALMARMSGSGATCFGLFANQDMAESAANRILDDHPGWWVAAAPIKTG